MLPRFRVLQVGDVHLSSSVNLTRSLDDKDQRFPRDLKQIISKQPLKKAFEKIYELISSDSISAILFMGDLTDYGEIAGYTACASYISNALQIGSNGRLNNLPVGIVSGNHDIDRVLAKSPSNTAKFLPLASALANVGLPPIPVKDPIWLDVVAGPISTSVALLNSCWGCGSPEFIPEEFRADVQKAIDQAIDRGRTKREIAAYYERQFDTPAFSAESIQSLVETAGKHQSNVLIAAAHHNLLPQRLPRLAPYTELVNSGALRSVLQEMEKPTIYLHGHIHQDPVEILQQPGGLPLVTISAPEIVDGFNVIEVVFTRGGMALSCRIIKWRFDDAGYIKRRSPISVPLIGQRRRSQKNSLIELYRIVLSAREIYWEDLKAQSKAIYDQGNDLEEDLELLESDGHITIENYSMEPYNWIVGAKL